MAVYGFIGFCMTHNEVPGVLETFPGSLPLLGKGSGHPVPEEDTSCKYKLYQIRRLLSFRPLVLKYDLQIYRN